jgi:hypothetical protein
VLAYLLAATAVFVALASLFWPESKLWFAVEELGGEFGPAAITPWVLWYLRTTMREIGLPTAVIDFSFSAQNDAQCRNWEPKPSVTYTWCQ